MKILLALSLLAALVSGCEREQSTMIEDTDLLEVYDVDLDIGDTDVEEDVADPEDEEVTSVGPTEIPADLIPSR